MPTTYPITWDNTGEKKFEAGTDKVVLFVADSSGAYGAGVPWSGITGITVNNTGGEATDLWADNIKYATLRSAEECEGTIKAYQEIPEFYPCDGALSPATGVVFGQQGRSTFGLCFRTKVGNDVSGLDYSYKIHIIYGATASPSERAYETINDSPDGMELSWDFKTTPVPVGTISDVEYKPVSHIEIDASLVGTSKMTALEAILYGSGSTAPHLPSPSEVLTAIA